MSFTIALSICGRCCCLSISFVYHAHNSSFQKVASASNTQGLSPIYSCFKCNKYFFKINCKGYSFFSFVKQRVTVVLLKKWIKCISYCYCCWKLGGEFDGAFPISIVWQTSLAKRMFLRWENRFCLVRFVRFYCSVTPSGVQYAT